MLNYYPITVRLYYQQLKITKMKNPANYSSMQQQIKHRTNNSDLYDILDLNRNCTVDDVKKSYKKLVLRFHPDKNTNQAIGAKEVFNKITNAYEKLSNKDSKAEYDEKTTKKSCPNYGNFQKKSAYFFNDSSQRFSNNANFRKFEQDLKQKQKQRRRKEFQKQTEQMQKQFSKFFSKYFEAKKSNEKTEKERKSYEYQKNQEKQNIERMKRKYEQQRRAKQRKQRNQMQQNKRKNLMKFFVALFAIILLGPYLMQFIGSKPLYSNVKTNHYKNQRKTSIFNSTYFVSDQFYTKEVSSETRTKIDGLMNKKYLAGLKKQCLTAQNTKKSLEDRAYRQKIGKKREYYLQQARNVNQNICDMLFNLISLNQDEVNKLSQ